MRLWSKTLAFAWNVFVLLLQLYSTRHLYTVEQMIRANSKIDTGCPEYCRDMSVTGNENTRC